MSKIYIINKASFLGYEDIAVNVDEDRLKVFIYKAQELDIKPLLGEAFYYDMITSLVFNEDGTLKEGDGGTPQKYFDLLTGSVYQNRSGQNIGFNGLIDALIYFAFARYVEADSVHYTATGPVIKQRDDSDSLKISDSAKLVSQHRSVANAYTNPAISFLDANKANYPLWKFNYKNVQARQPGPRISGIDKTDVRRGYGRDNYGYPYGLIN